MSATIAMFAFAVMRDPADQQQADEQDDRDREDVDGPPSPGGAVIASGSVGTEELVEQRVEVAGEADRDRGGADRELEHEVPADDERDELAERRVACTCTRCRPPAPSTRTPRNRARRARRRRPASTNDSVIDGPRLGRGGLAGEDEDAGADDRAHAQHHDVERAEVAAQLVRLELGARDRLVDRLTRPEELGCRRHGAALPRRPPRQANANGQAAGAATGRVPGCSARGSSCVRAGRGRRTRASP